MIYDPLRQNLYKRANNKILSFSLQEGIVGTCFRTKSYVIANNVKQDKMFCKNTDDPSPKPTHRLICIPLTYRPADKQHSIVEDAFRGLMIAVNREAEFTHSDG